MLTIIRLKLDHAESVVNSCPVAVQGAIALLDSSNLDFARLMMRSMVDCVFDCLYSRSGHRLSHLLNDIESYAEDLFSRTILFGTAIKVIS